MLPIKQFTSFITENSLFAHQDNILLAVSGGMDSVLMAHLFKEAGFNFGIAHCNFQLRGQESINDQLFCEALAQQLEVPIYIKKFDTLLHASEQKISTQMAARNLRYQWFEETRVQHNYTAIALAHHQNDAIETILLNLIRGTGIAGMHGILPKNGHLVRPLLFLTRDEIKQTIDAHDIAFIEDSSNLSTKYARNKIRLEIVPKLKELNPQIEQTFESNLRHFKNLELLLNNTVKALKNELFICVDEDIKISIAKVKRLEPLPLLLFNLLKDFGFNETTVNDLILALGKQSGKIFEAPGYQLITDREYFIISKKKIVNNLSLTINQGDHTLNYGSYKVGIIYEVSPLIVKNNPLSVSVDADELIYPLTLRDWQQGDFFYPLGMSERKKLSDFFINQKIAQNKKSQIPLLVNGNNQIIWIVGYRPDDRFKVTDKTKKVTIFEFIKF